MSTNPFLAGTFDGRSTYHTDAVSRIARVRDFSRAQCEAALKVPGLQKTVEAVVRTRMRALDKACRPQGGQP